MELHYYIGHSTNEDIRFASSSGGVGSSIIKYLLDSGLYGTSMTFVFNTRECMYEPRMIHSFSEYKNCGSIYQDTDNVRFIKEHLDDISNGIVVTCMPCQVNPIRSILNKNNIKHFIISLCCSGQTTVEGTWLYYKCLGLNKSDIYNIRYRGDGWPSGITITLKDGSIIKKANYTFPWTLMHQSLLYRPKRCQYCTIKTNPNSEVSLADPWLKEYLESDTIGNTVIICNPEGEKVLKKMEEDGYLLIKHVEESVYVQSQLGTIESKTLSNKYKTFNKIVINMSKEGGFYKKMVTSNVVLLKVHVMLLNIMRRILCK